MIFQPKGCTKLHNLNEYRKVEVYTKKISLKGVKVMPMVPFFTKLPDIAAVETRELIIVNNKNIPTGAYGLIESYCDELNCDCRRVFINVVSEGSPAKIFATISYGWETPKFYKKWMEGADSDTMKKMMHPYLEISCLQSEYANDFLELFQGVIKDKSYVERLARHYLLFKEEVNRESTE